MQHRSYVQISFHKRLDHKNNQEELAKLDENTENVEISGKNQL